MRRSVPVVSFTTSHRALMYKMSQPLLGKEMNSQDRNKAAWDELPFSHWGFSNKQRFEWTYRMINELGLRDAPRSNKVRYLVLLFSVVSAIRVGYTMVWEGYFYRWVYWKYPAHIGDMEVGRTEARNKGYDVWCADGQYVRPFFHLNAPMFTMKVEDL